MSLKNLDLDYIDMYLVHAPFSFKPKADYSGPIIHENGDFEIDKINDIVEVWKVFL